MVFDSSLLLDVFTYRLGPFHSSEILEFGGEYDDVCLTVVKKYKISGSHKPFETSIPSLLHYSDGYLLSFYLDFMPQLLQDKFMARSTVLRILYTSHQRRDPQRILDVSLWDNQRPVLYILRPVDHNDAIFGVLHKLPMF